MSQITGTHVNYFFHCHRQLWLFGRNIQMEQENENVQIGKLLSNESYSRNKHEWAFTHPSEDLDNFINSIKVDFIDYNKGVIHEIKKSKSFEEGHEWQILFYIYILSEMGVIKKDGTCFTGEIDYPLHKQRVSVQLNEQKKQKLIEIMKKIKMILESEIIPDRIDKKICKHCSYFELCWS